MTEQAKTDNTQAQLVVIEPTTAVALFTEGQGVAELLADIRQKATSLVPDITTAKGRKEIAVKVRGSWLAPVSIIEPNDADRRADALNAERLRVMDKARAAGLTDDEIRMLGDV